MPYVTEITTTNAWQQTRTERSIDLVRFAHDLARHLNGSEHDGDRWSARINIGGTDDVLRLTWSEYKGKVTASMEAADLRHDDIDQYDSSQRPVTIFIRPDARPIQQIAKDIRRRCIEPNQTILAAQRAHAQARRESRSRLVGIVDTVQRSCPGAVVTLTEDRIATLSLTEPYIQARIYSNGTVSIDRMSINVDQLTTILRTLRRQQESDVLRRELAGIDDPEHYDP